MTYGEFKTKSESIILKEWLRTYLDKFIALNIPNHLKKEFKENCFVAGGCFSNLINGNYGDIDIFLKDKVFTVKLNKYFNAKAENNDEWLIVTDNAITILCQNYKWDNYTTQIITKWSGEPKEIIDGFDFEHLQNYYDYKTDELFTTQLIENLKQCKKLNYVGSEYPLSSLFRLRKFIDKGFVYSNSDLSRMIGDILRLDLSTAKAVREQATGLYSEDTEKFVYNILNKTIKNKKQEDEIW